MSVDTSLLDNWQVLNEKIKTLPEEQVEQLLNIERKGQRRAQFLLRIYGRYNTLRTIRERRELMAE